MIRDFEKLYGPAPIRVYRAPGRTNLIGEHTDYNLGFVMPVALDLATYIAVAPSGDGRVRIRSEHRGETKEWAAAEIPGLQPAHHWTDYPIGVAQELIRAGFKIEGCNLLIRSTVPEGSGLSSSAALEVSSALAFLDGRELAPLDLARLCQRAERDFVGMPCGIMDPFISVFGREGAAIRIDCRSLEYEAVPLPAEVEFLAVNTLVKHALASSAYKERTQQCAAAVELIRHHDPQVDSLRDVSPVLFEKVAETLPAVVRRRARHVVYEDDRVNQFIEASAHGDKIEMGRLLIASHRSLQHDYEVSCAELDFLVDTAITLDGVYGARMTGGGFGGCTVNMLRPDRVAAFREEIAQAYREKFGVSPEIYPCRPSTGAGPVTNFETIPAAGN